MAAARSRRDGPVELDQKTEQRIVSLYRDHGVTLYDIRKRYRVGEPRLKAILAKGGVTVIERNRLPQAEILDV